MKLELAEKLAEIYEGYTGDYEDRDERLSEDYSGRGMFGKETVGLIVGDISTLLEAVLYAVKDGALTEDDMSDMDTSGFRTDSMGFSTIIY